MKERRERKKVQPSTSDTKKSEPKIEMYWDGVDENGEPIGGGPYEEGDVSIEKKPCHAKGNAQKHLPLVDDIPF